MKYVPDEIVVFGIEDRRTGLISNYLRYGGCTVGCGEGCRKMLIPVDPAVLNRPPEQLADWKHWLELHGVQLLVNEERRFVDVLVPLACKHLQADATCGVVGLPERPAMCGDYPQHPNDLDTVEDVCTYGFVRIGDGLTREQKMMLAQTMEQVRGLTERP